MRRASIAASFPAVAFFGGLVVLASFRIEGAPAGVAETATSLTLAAATVALVIATVGAWRRVHGGTLRWPFVMVAAAVLPWLASLVGSQLATSAALHTYAMASWELRVSELPAVLAVVEQLDARGSGLAATSLLGVALALVVAGRESRWVALAALGLAIPAVLEAILASRSAARSMAVFAARDAGQIEEAIESNPYWPTWLRLAVVVAAFVVVAYPLFRHRRQGGPALALLLVLPLAAELAARDRVVAVRASVALPPAVVFARARSTERVLAIAGADGLRRTRDATGPLVPLDDSLWAEPEVPEAWQDAYPYRFPDSVPEWLEEIPASERNRGEKMPSRETHAEPRPADELLRQILSRPRCIGQIPGPGASLLLTPSGMDTVLNVVRSSRARSLSLVVDRRPRPPETEHLSDAFRVDLGAVFVHLPAAIDPACQARYDQRYLRATVAAEPVRRLESRSGATPLEERTGLDGFGLVYLRVSGDTEASALLATIARVDELGFEPVLVSEWPADPEAPVEHGPAPPTGPFQRGSLSAP